MLVDSTSFSNRKVADGDYCSFMELWMGTNVCNVRGSPLGSHTLRRRAAIMHVLDACGRLLMHITEQERTPCRG